MSGVPRTRDVGQGQAFSWWMLGLLLPERTSGGGSGAPAAKRRRTTAGAVEDAVEGGADDGEDRQEYEEYYSDGFDQAEPPHQVQSADLQLRHVRPLPGIAARSSRV